MANRLLVISMLSLLLGVALCTSAFCIALQLPFDVGQTWGPRTYDNHNCWGPYDDKTHAIDWFLVTGTQSGCPYWTSTYTNSQGQNLRAACAGKVYLMNYDSSGYGNYLVIQSSEDSTYFTLYAHMDSYKSGLAVGQSVSAGDLVGAVGKTGGGSGGFSHLHMELEHGTSSSNWIPQDISALTIDNQTVSFGNWTCTNGSFVTGYYGPALVSRGSLMSGYGSVAGCISDAFNVPVAGATVRTTTGGYATTTDSSGSYTLSSVSNGSYTLTASAIGYTPKSIGITVYVNQTATGNINLQSNTGMTPTSPSGLNIALTSTATTDSNYSSSFTGALAIDGVISGSSKWCSLNTSSQHWIELDLGSTAQVNGYLVYLAGAAGELASYNWKAFQIQSSSSASGPWTNEVVVNNASQVSSVLASYQTPKHLEYIRLLVTNCGIDNYARLPEFQVCGPSYPSPGAPVVTDDGLYTTNTASIHATWAPADNVPVAEYQYAIGTTSGGTDTLGWASAGTQLSATQTGLSLSPNGTYYVSVRARSSMSGWGTAGASDGIMVARSVPTIAQAKSYADGSAVALISKTVSAKIGSCFWIEEADRTAGIRINSDSSVTPGELVTVLGKLLTTQGERSLDTPVVSPAGD